MRLFKYIFLNLILCNLLCLLSGCSTISRSVPKCTVLFEDNSTLFLQNQMYEIPKSDDLSVSIGVPHGERISYVNYDDYSISAKTSESLSYDYYTLTLHRIRYSTIIRLNTAPSFTTTYHWGKNHSQNTTIIEESPHLYFNTLPYDESYEKKDFVAIGWNTEPDGSGMHVGFGSRINHRELQHLDLYLEELPCTSADSFTYFSSNGEITITGYHGSGDLIIPSYIDGLPVTTIATNAFQNMSVSRIVFPATLKTVSDNAFANVISHDFYFFDNIYTLPENAFASYAISNLHINAVLAPVYSGSYFDTFADKADYLSSVKDEKKIVLFCGSSARFGYDSSLIESTFPDYKVVNMGVYAYSNMLPQAKLLLHFMKDGDILLSSPELDAIEEQFCCKTSLDKETFCLFEANYDLLAMLDCTEFTQIFEAFTQYNQERQHMRSRSYLDSASYYNEDGVLQNSFTYNRWGDYILHRENNITGKTFGIKRAYYNVKYISQTALDSLNAVYDEFAQHGVTVCFTYSPRSKISISDDSTAESILELENFFKTHLHATVISSIYDSLMDPLYFYGTDNHLSSEGVQIHTTSVIKDLQPILEDKP